MSTKPTALQSRSLPTVGSEIAIAAAAGHPVSWSPMEPSQLSWIANFIWGIADDVLRQRDLQYPQAEVSANSHSKQQET